MPIDLGQISFGIGPDTTRLRSSIQDIVRFGSTVEQAYRAAANGATAYEGALARQERAMISALQRVQNFQDQISRARAPANLTSGFNTLSTTALDRFTQRMSSGRLNTIQFQREMERFNQTMNNGQRIFRNWSDASSGISSGTLINSLKSFSSAAVLVAGPLSGIATRISVLSNLAEHFNLVWAVSVAGIAAGAYAFFKVSTSVIDFERKLQNITQTLIAVSGSETIAATELKYLSEFADKAGVKFDTLAKNYSHLEAASKGTILEGERMRHVFEGITLAGSKLGLSNEDLDGSLRAIQQMISKGRIQAEELRGQLGDRLPGAMQAMAEAVGVTTQKLDGMLKKGELGISILPKFTDALLKRLGISETSKIDTITAAENRLYNARLRMLDQIDKVVGISKAYVLVLDRITNAINGTDGSIANLIKGIAAIAGAFTGLFLGGAVVSGIIAIGAAIRGLTLAVASLNVAMLASGVGGILSLLARLGLAAIGAAGGYYMMDQALKGTSQSFLTALPPVDAYIKAQETLVSSIRKPTLEFITQQETLKTSLQSQLSSLEQYTKAYEDSQYRISRSNGVTRIEPANTPDLIRDKIRDAAKLRVELSSVEERLVKLREILKKQSEQENNNRNDPTKELTNRQTLAIKNASDTVKELNEQYNLLFLNPAAKEWGTVLNDVNKQVENFRDQLSRTELPAAKVTELTDKYAEALKKVKFGEYSLKTYTSFFQGLEGVFSRGLNTALNEWIDTILDGKDALEALKNVGKSVARDLLQTFIQLAALNPLKNALFGTNYSTLGGSAGVGGLLGDLFKGFGFANGGIMTSNGPLPLKTYSGGGIANSPQVAIFGEGRQNEAFVPLPDGRSIPVTLSGAGGGGGNVEIHIHEASGTKSNITQSKSSSGGTRIDVMIQRTAKEAILSDLFSGGEIAQTMERRYGLDRTKGIA